MESGTPGGIIIDGIEFPAPHCVQTVFSQEGLLTSHVYTMALLGSRVTLLQCVRMSGAQKRLDMRGAVSCVFHAQVACPVIRYFSEVAAPGIEAAAPRRLIILIPERKYFHILALGKRNTQYGASCSSPHALHTREAFIQLTFEIGRRQGHAVCMHH